MKKEIIEELKNKLFKRLKRYNIQFGCFDEVFEVLVKALSQQKQEFRETVEGIMNHTSGGLPCEICKARTKILKAIEEL